MNNALILLTQIIICRFLVVKLLFVVVVVVVVVVAGQRSCPGFWPLLSCCGFYSVMSSLHDWVEVSLKGRHNIQRKICEKWLWSDHFFQWCIVYTAIDRFGNWHWMWTAACVSMNLILPLHYIDLALVLTSTQFHHHNGALCNENTALCSVLYRIIKDVSADICWNRSLGNARNSEARRGKANRREDK